MRIPTTSIVFCAAFVCSSSLAQTEKPSVPPKPKTAAEPAKPDAEQGKPNADNTSADDQVLKSVKASAEQVKAIKDALKEDDPDWALVLGIGSLVKGSETDYVNESNVVRAAGLGRATPQLLTGVSFRSNVPNPIRRYRVSPADKAKCGDSKTDEKCPLALWQRRPFSAFVSLKFSPGASQVLNGYVIGGSYAIAHYLNALIGFALSPVNEPSPGFRSTAYQFVINEQKQGRLLNFDPVAMKNNARNSFDGFPVTDNVGALIYKGNPLTVHYRGGVVIGVSIPIYFGSVFK